MKFLTLFALLLLSTIKIMAATPAAVWDGTGTVIWGLDETTGLLRPVTTKIDSSGNTGIVTFVALDPLAAPLAVSIRAGVAGISVTATINAPTTGQTVHVSNTVNTTIQSAATGLAVNVSNTVTVNTHAVTQSGTWTFVPNPSFATASNTRVVVTTSTTQLLASNTNRKYAYIVNQTGAAVYIKLGVAAVVSEGMAIGRGGIYEISQNNLWTGTINAIFASGSGTIDVFEGTP